MPTLFDPTKYGARKVQSPAQGGGQPVQQPGVQTTGVAQQQPPIQQQAQQPQAPQQPGFIQGALQSVAQPVLKLANSIGKAGLQAGSIGAQVLGAQGVSDKLWSGAQSIDKGVDYGYFGKVGALGDPSKSGGDQLKEALGTGLQVGSLLVPEGKALGGAKFLVNNPLLRDVVQGVTKNAIQGVGSGALYGAGEALNEGGGVGDALSGAFKGGLAGGVVGGALGAVSPLAKAGGRAIASTGKLATSLATGLNRDTVSLLVNSPEKLSPNAIEGLDREYLGTKVHTATTQRLEELSGTGKEYTTIKEARTPVEIPSEQVRVPNPVNPETGAPIVDPKTNLPYTDYKVNKIFSDVLQKHGIDLDPATGQIETTVNSVPLQPGDKEALQRFYYQYGRYTNLDSNSILNARRGLDILGDYAKDPNKTDISNVIAKELRSGYDQVAKVQVPGLSELDAKFAPERKLLGKIRSDYLNPDGSLKDNALNKIANLAGAGKNEILGRLEKIVPGITSDIHVVKALEDIQNTAGNKVGTYTRSAISGGAALTGNIPMALIGFAMSTPKISVPIIRTFGQLKNVSGPIIDNILNRMSTGRKLSEPMKRFVLAAFESAATNGDVTKKKQVKAAGAEQPADAYLKSLGY